MDCSSKILKIIKSISKTIKEINCQLLEEESVKIHKSKWKFRILTKSIKNGNIPIAIYKTRKITNSTEIVKRLLRR